MNKIPAEINTLSGALRQLSQRESQVFLSLAYAQSCLSPWERWHGKAVTERVLWRIKSTGISKTGSLNTLSGALRQLSQRESQVFLSLAYAQSCLSPWERWHGKAVTERVLWRIKSTGISKTGSLNTLSGALRQLSQRESQVFLSLAYARQLSQRESQGGTVTNTNMPLRARSEEGRAFLRSLPFSSCFCVGFLNFC